MAKPTNTDSLIDAEVTFRKSIGCAVLSVKEMDSRFRALGYRLDRSRDCKAMSRYVSPGPQEGRTYPACTTGLAEIDTGRSYAHVDSRRDANFRAAQALRGKVFALIPGFILEV